MLYDNIGNVIAGIGTPQFATCVHQLLGRIVAFDWMNLIVVRDDEPPRVGYCSVAGPTRQIILGPYVDDRYTKDPFLIGIRDRALVGLCDLHDLAITQGGISPDYMSLLASADVSDEVCYISNEYAFGRAIVSVVRTRQHGTFSLSEQCSLRSIEPIVLTALDSHFERFSGEAGLVGNLGNEQDRMSLLRRGLSRLANGELTKREREIGRLILCGYSTNAIAATLEISPGTVKIHRKNLYKKLTISSQGELFALFFWSMLQDHSSYTDPPS